MPIYDYICGACGERTEFMHGVHAEGPATCPKCGGGPMKKALHAPAVHFKGSGWAKKERAAGGAKPAKDAGAPAAAVGEGNGGGTGNATAGSAAAEGSSDSKGSAPASSPAAGPGSKAPAPASKSASES